MKKEFLKIKQMKYFLTRFRNDLFLGVRIGQNEENKIKKKFFSVNFAVSVQLKKESIGEEKEGSA